MAKLNKQKLLEIKQLISKEMKMFDPELKKLSLHELEQYYENKRIEEYENDNSIPVDSFPIKYTNSELKKTVLIKYKK